MGPTIPLVILVSVVVLAGGFFLVRRLMRRRVDATYYHFRCPGCKRRLRYQARQVGNKGRCSHCGRDLSFPAVSQSIE